MKLRTHVSSALAVAPIVAFTTGGFHLLLMGSVFPNINLTVRKTGHRMGLLHMVEIPLAGFLLLRFVKIPYMFGFPVGYLARCFFAGWLVHLLGDFLQGGVRSLIFGKKSASGISTGTGTATRLRDWPQICYLPSLAFMGCTATS